MGGGGGVVVVVGGGCAGLFDGVCLVVGVGDGGGRWEVGGAVGYARERARSVFVV